MSLEGAITRLQTHALSAGCLVAPATPPEDLSDYPFSVAYEESGDLHPEAYNHGYDVATIAVDMHVGRQDLPYDVARAYTLRLAFMQKLIGDPTLNGEIETIEGDPHREFMGMKYGDTKTIGYRWRIRVKYNINGA